MYDDILDVKTKETITKEAENIVNQLRENTDRFISKMNLPEVKEVCRYKQSDKKIQLDFVDKLLKNGINVEVVNKPVCLIEDENKENQVVILMKTRQIVNLKEGINIEENFKSIFLYIWVDFISEEDMTYSFFRYNTYGEKYYRCKRKHFLDKGKK